MSERPFHRFIVLGAAFVIISMSIGTLFTLGVFLTPIEDSMGWSRSAIGAIGLFNWIVMGAGGLVAGYLSDRLGTRPVVLTGAVLLALGLVLSSHVQEIWQLYVTFGLLVGAGVSTFYVPLTVLAVKWFDDRRGMAASVVSAGNGLGLLALAPLTRWLISEFDWRVAFLVLGNLALVLVVPCALLLREPGADGRSTDTRSSGLSLEGLSSAGAQKWPPHSPSGGRPSAVWTTWASWAIAVTHFCCCAAHSGPLFHLVSHAMDQGVPKMAAASLLGASGLTSILGRVGTGIVADRVGSKRTLLVALGLQALVIFLYLFASRTGTLYVLSLAFGVAYGAAMPLYALVIRDSFGERGMGTAYGAVFFISSIGMGLGSYAGGAIHDALGTYYWLFLGSFAIGSMAVVLGLTLRPPATVALTRPSLAPGS